MRFLLAVFVGSLSAVYSFGQGIAPNPSLPTRIRKVEYRTRAHLSLDDERDTNLDTPHSTKKVPEIDEEYVRMLLQDRGYWRASIKTKLVPLRTHNHARWFDVVFEIDEGLPYYLSGVTWTGMKQFGEADLNRSMRIRPGEVASRRAITAGLQEVQKLYAGIGYVNCTLVPHNQLDDAGYTLALGIAVDEGGQFYFGELSLPGLDDVHREMLLQHWQTIRAMPYSPEKEEAFFRGVLWPADPKLRSNDYLFYREFIEAHFDQSERTVNFSIRFTPSPPVGNIH